MPPRLAQRCFRPLSTAGPSHYQTRGWLQLDALVHVNGDFSLVPKAIGMVGFLVTNGIAESMC